MKSLLLILAAFSFLALSGCCHGQKDYGKKRGDRMHKMWQQMDTNSDGIWTKEEFDKAHSDSFAKMDANSDGKITKEEMMAHHKSMKNKKKPCCD